MNINTINPSINNATPKLICLKPLPPASVLPPPITATDLLADTTITKPKELVSGLIHLGTKTVIAGGSKVGKTAVALDLGLSVATGSDFLHWTTTQGKVLLVNFELQPAFFKERLDALRYRRKIVVTDNLVIWNVRGKAEDFEALLQNIISEVEGKGYSLIILDPIYKAMTGKSESAATSVGMLCNQLERLIERCGAAVVYTHHFPKGNAKKKALLDRMAGSGVFARDADSIIALTDHEVPGCFTVEMKLRNLPEQPSFVVEWQYPVMVEREDLEPKGEDNLNAARARQMLTLLLGNPMTTGEWEAAALLNGIPHASFFRSKGELKDGGHITFNTLDKTWSVSPGLLDTSDTPDTTDTNRPETNSGSIKSITVSRETRETGTGKGTMGAAQ